MDKLSKEEAAYFESGGATDLPGDTEPTNTVEATEQAAEAAEPAEKAPEQADAQSGEQVKAEEPKTGPEAKDEQSEELGEDDEPVDNRPIPYAALKKEREQTRALKQENRRLQEVAAQQAAIVEQRLAAIQQQLQPQQQEESQQETMPDPDEDFQAWARWQHNKTIEAEKNAREWQEYEQQQQAYETQKQQIVGTYLNEFQQVAQTNPEVVEARQFMLAKRLQERMAIGESRQSAEKNLAEDEFAFVAQAMNNGANPALALFEYAKTQGYAPKPKEPEPAPQPDPAEQLERVKAGQEAHKTLSTAGGTAAAGKLDADSLGKMSDSEFTAWLEKNGEDGFRALAGG